jgi:hypothetical protein
MVYSTDLRGKKIIRNIATDECSSESVTAEGFCIVNVGHAER